MVGLLRRMVEVTVKILLQLLRREFAYEGGLELLAKLLPFALPKAEPESYAIGKGGLADSWEWQ